MRESSISAGQLGSGLVRFPVVDVILAEDRQVVNAVRRVNVRTIGQPPLGVSEPMSTDHATGRRPRNPGPMTGRASRAPCAHTQW